MCCCFYIIICFDVSMSRFRVLHDLEPPLGPQDVPGLSEGGAIICVHIYIYIYIYTYIYIYIYTYIYIYRERDLYNIYIYICIYMYLYDSMIIYSLLYSYFMIVLDIGYIVYVLYV